MEIYDAAVVGAGPAGSMAAALLAKKGLKVLLLEKKKLPRDKVCGCLISARALTMLPPDFKKYLAPGNLVKSVALINRGKEFLYHTQSEQSRKSAPSAAPSFAPLGLLYRRSEFDQLIARYAESCGADLQEECPLIHLELQHNRGGFTPFYRLTCASPPGQKQFSARFVVGADGAYSTTAVAGGLRSRSLLQPVAWGCSSIDPAPHEGMSPQRINFYTLNLCQGLGWSFPGEGWVSRGVAGLARIPALKKEMARIFPEISSEKKPSFWPLPFTGPARRVARGGIILIGDAAGLIEPFSGEGVYHAFKSAYLAAYAIATGVDEDRYAGNIYAALFYKYFRKGYPAALSAACCLQISGLLKPSSLPPVIARIMTNRYWSNRDLPKQYLLR